MPPHPASAPPPAPAPAANAPAARWYVRLLGGLELSDGQQTQRRLPSRAIVALLARLALQPERAHPREELIELLWPGVALDVGRNRLRQSLSSLKALLEPAGTAMAPVLAADRASVHVVPGALACDAREFERHVRAGRAAAARALYRGELLPGFYDEWIADERLRLEALHDRVADGDDADEPRTEVGIARADLAPVPVLPPGHGGAAPAAPDIGRATLPTYLTRVFGADVQAARLRATVMAHRLVTLVGPGGSGKTRLAVELAHALRQTPQWSPRWAGEDPAGQRPFDLVAFVPLVSCTTRAQALGALLGALQVQATQADPLDDLLPALDGRRTLLVLDNFEQLVEAAAGIVARLGARLPELHLLVTSRRTIGLDGEREFPVAALELPAPDLGPHEAATNPAVALFIDRARAVRSDFHLGQRNHRELIELVRALEGMPLAIELAASRVRSFSPADMLTRLRRPLDGAAMAGTPGLDLLARSGPRGGLDPRHASMQRVIEWSWQLLTPAQARVLGALTVFHGGCGAAAVCAVCRGEGDPLLQLDELLAHSLVQSVAPSREIGAAGALRFGLYEPIREFVAARLAATDAAYWRQRHRDWLLAWAAALPPTPSLDELRLEMPNIVAALASATADAAPEAAVQLLIRLRRVLEDVPMPSDGLTLLARAVDACGDPELQAQGHSLLGPLMFVGGRRHEALAHARAGLEACPHEAPWRGRALHALARVRWRSTRDAAGLLPLLDEAEQIALASADPELQASLLAMRAFITNQHHRDHAAGEALHERALAQWERLGNQHAVNSGRYNLAVCAQNQHRNEEALARLAALEHSARALHDWHRLSQALNVRGNALSDLRRWQEAVATFRECIRLAWDTATPHDLAYGLWNLPRALAHVREPAAALRVAAFAAEFWSTRFGTLSPQDDRDLRRVRRLAARQLPPEQVRAEWSAGRQLALADAVALALGR